MENTGGGSWDLLELGRWTSSSTSFSDHQQVVPGGHGGAHQSQYQLHHSLLQQQQMQQMQRQSHHHHHHHHHDHHHHHHLTCLKLGKRQYCGEPQQQPQPQQASAKRERPSAIGGVNVIPRCQVEGCNKPLLDAKDYHRRHKVCELHSKAPVVVVLGAEQRFCQQCSRFHAVSEFDDTKRSCRRRLAGHNERRRKSSNGAGGQFIMRNHHHHHHSSLENSLIDSHFPFLPPTSPGRALSLLSSKVTPWISTPELSSRSSAALRELIAENRASLLARQLF